jgi:hypothetical protein
MADRIDTLTGFYAFLERAAVYEMAGQFEDVQAEEGGVRFHVDAERSFLVAVTEDLDGLFPASPSAAPTISMTTPEEPAHSRGAGAGQPGGRSGTASREGSGDLP